MILRVLEVLVAALDCGYVFEGQYATIAVLFLSMTNAKKIVSFIVKSVGYRLTIPLIVPRYG